MLFPFISISLQKLSAKKQNIWSNLKRCLHHIDKCQWTNFLKKNCGVEVKVRAFFMFIVLYAFIM